MGDIFLVFYYYFLAHNYFTGRYAIHGYNILRKTPPLLLSIILKDANT